MASIGHGNSDQERETKGKSFIWYELPTEVESRRYLPL